MYNYHTTNWDLASELQSLFPSRGVQALAINTWGRFWSDYWYFLSNPSEMDPDLEVGFYVSTGVAVGAGTAAGGFWVVGFNPTVWGAGAGGIATTAQAVDAFGGPAAFGKVIQWGNGAAGAIGKTANITLAEIQAAGISLPIARWWLRFYQEAVASGKGGQTAIERVKLMERVIELL